MHFNMSQGPLLTEIYRKNAAAQNHGAHFVRACAVETHVKISQEQLYTEIYRKNAAAGKPTAQTLCERGQPKRTSRFHKRHFIRKFTGKMPRSRSPERTQNADTRFVRAWAVETHVKISQETLYTEIYRKNAGAQSEHPDQAPAFTRTVRTPQCRPTVWGIKYELYNQYWLNQNSGWWCWWLQLHSHFAYFLGWPWIKGSKVAFWVLGSSIWPWKAALSSPHRPFSALCKREV